MVALPRPHGAPQIPGGILALYEAHLHKTRSTEQALAPRGLGSPIGGASALYIFLGILISLCIAAPVLARLRKKQEKDVIGYIQRAKRAAAEEDGRVAELASLRQRHERLEQEQEQYRTSQQQHENQLRDERLRAETLQQRMRDIEQSMQDREEALTLARQERDTATEEAREARQSHGAVLGRIENLERDVQAKEDNLRSLQQRYNHVDQEYRRLVFEMPDNS